MKSDAKIVLTSDKLMKSDCNQKQIMKINGNPWTSSIANSKAMKITGKQMKRYEKTIKTDDSELNSMQMS